MRIDEPRAAWPQGSDTLARLVIASDAFFQSAIDETLNGRTHT